MTRNFFENISLEYGLSRKIMEHQSFIDQTLIKKTYSEIMTIIISSIFWASLLFPEYWIFPLFKIFSEYRGFTELPLFIGLIQKEKYIFFFRIFSSFFSVFVAAALIWINKDKIFSSFRSTELNCNSLWKNRLKFLFINLILSISVLFIFPGDFSQTSYISFLNFLITQIVFFTITGPIIEELTYRIAIYSLLRQKFPPKMAIFISSIIFATFHFRYGLPFCVIFFTFGVLWAYAYETSKDPYVPFILHSTNNLINSIAFLIVKTGG